MGILAQRAADLAQQDAEATKQNALWKDKVCAVATSLAHEFTNDLQEIAVKQIQVSAYLHTILLRKNEGQSLQVAVEDDDLFRIGVSKRADDFFYMGQNNSWLLTKTKMLDYVIDWARSS